MNNNTNNYDVKTLPKWELDNFCRYIAEATEEYMKDPENQKRFQKWKVEREKIRAEKEIQYVI